MRVAGHRFSLGGFWGVFGWFCLVSFAVLVAFSVAKFVRSFGLGCRLGLCGLQLRRF